MKFILTLTTLLFLFNINLFAQVDYFWVGDGGNWSDLSHWASSSGGAGNAYPSIPSLQDNVYFDANSFSLVGQSVNFNGTDIFAHDFDWSAVTNTPTLTGVGSNNEIKVTGDFILSPSMNVNYRSALFMQSTATAVFNPNGNDMAGSGFGVFSPIIFEAGGTYTLDDDLNIPGGDYRNGITVRGNTTLDLNGYDMSAGTITIYDNVSLDMTGSAVTTRNCCFGWQVKTETATLMTSGSIVSTAEFEGGTAYTYNNVLLTPGHSSNAIKSGSSTIEGTFTADASVRNATIRGGGVFNGPVIANNYGVTYFEGSKTLNNTVTINSPVFRTFQNQNFNGLLSLTVAGATYVHTHTININAGLSLNTSCAAFVKFIPAYGGGTINFAPAVGNVTLDFVEMQNLRVTGVNTYTANNSIDLGGNTGWIINAPTPQTYYWVGHNLANAGTGTGDWFDPNNWALTSGGVPDPCVPNAFDKVFFDAQSFTATTGSYVVDVPSIMSVNDVTWTTGVTNTPTWQSSGAGISFNGSLVLTSGMNYSLNSQVTFATTSSSVINMSSKKLMRYAIFDAAGTYDLQTDFEMVEPAPQANRMVIRGNTTFNSNDFNIYAGNGFHIENTPATINLGSSTITTCLSSDGYNFWGFRIDGNGATIIASATTINSHRIDYSGTKALELGTVNIVDQVACRGTPITNGYIEGTNITFKGLVTANNTGHFYTVPNGNGNPNVYEQGLIFNSTDITMNTESDVRVQTVMNASGTAYFNTNNTFENFVANTTTPDIFLGAGMTQIFTGTVIISGGDCLTKGFLKVQSTDANIQAIISKSSGSVDFPFILLRGVSAVGGAVWTATDAVDLGNNTGITFGLAPPVTYYWTGFGATDNWGDTGNWSNVSGGASIGCVPTIIDDAIFDENSFTGSTVVDINADIEFNNMFWVEGITSATFSGTGSVEVLGGITFNSTMDLTYVGQTDFIALSTGKIIHSAGQSFNGDIVFNGLGGGWIFDDAFDVGNNDITLTNGLLVTSGNTVDAGRLLSRNSNTRTLDITNSTVTLCNWADANNPQNYGWTVTSGSLTLLTSGSTIVTPVFNGGDDLTYNNIQLVNASCGGNSALSKRLYGNNLTIDGTVLFSGGSTGQIMNGNNTFNSTVTANTPLFVIGTTGANTFNAPLNITSSLATINGTNTFESINLTTCGGDIRFQSGQTQTLTSGFSASGLGGTPTVIEATLVGLGNEAFLEFLPAGDWCGINLFIRNVHVTTGSMLAGLGSQDNGNTTGWKFENSTASCQHNGGAGCGLVILPVELVEFTANYNPDFDVNQIDWTTSSESQNAYFEVEKSADGVHFETFKKVAGAIDSEQTNVYQVFDTEPYADVSYYRLKQVDVDGAETYSKVVAVVRYIDKREVKVYPNPLSPYATLKIEINGFEAQNASLKVFDNSAKLLITRDLPILKGKNTYNLKQNLAQGFYTLQIATQDNLIIKKIIIQ